MTKRENPRRREREFNKFQEKSNRYQKKTIDSRIEEKKKEIEIMLLEQEKQIVKQ